MNSYGSKISATLTLAEKRDLEIPCELYSSVKILDLIEKMNALDKITSDEYGDKRDKMMSKIEKLENQMRIRNKNYTLNAFVDEYGLKDCTWALQRLRDGKSELPQRGGNYMIIAQLTSKFVELADTLTFNEADPAVKIFLPLLDEMIQLLTNFKRTIAKDMTLHERYAGIKDKIANRGLNDKLSEQEYKELIDINIYAQRQFHLYLSTMK
eukprot:CAMPEP_0176436068 /NCGR_PEP_ID=MMETSP0127-20121128/17720_1 /TAXON_ID=938130 /ORGANISM="Platyophrya macrostoma, Strain WH" /LENGTH=210 /DNA_ID=CAMNT_0017819261 /DNA_START=66 /DNA_END=698 /DNA_ORIENTATION=-